MFQWIRDILNNDNKRPSDLTCVKVFLLKCSQMEKNDRLVGLCDTDFFAPFHLKYKINRVIVWNRWPKKDDLFHHFRLYR